MNSLTTISSEKTSQTCSIKAQQLILQSYGIQVTTIELIEVAKQNGWFVEGVGSPIEFLGELLNYYDVQAVQMKNATIHHLIRELSQGHKIIVAVDSTTFEKSENWQEFEEVLYGKEGQFIYVVVGIDTTNLEQVNVVLTDPSNPTVSRFFIADKFLEVWKQSGYFMVATTEPAPLAKNPLMQHFDYQKGHIKQFANVVFEELIQRLDNNGYIQKKSNKKHWFFFGASITLLLAIFFIYLSTFSPIYPKVSFLIDPNYAIPNLGFEQGNVTISYCDKQPDLYEISKNNLTIQLDKISDWARRKNYHIVFESFGYVKIDTLIPISEHIILPIKRNNELATFFGYLRDEQGKPIENALLTIQDMTACSDSTGYFRIDIPFEKQKLEQTLIVNKSGYKSWIHHGCAPSQTEPCFIILQN